MGSATDERTKQSVSSHPNLSALQAINEFVGFFLEKRTDLSKNEVVIEASADLKCGIESADFPIRNDVNFIIKFTKFQKVHRSSQNFKKFIFGPTFRPISCRTAR
jgi:GTP-binding protein EngB required for normal cell division